MVNHQKTKMSFQMAGNVKKSGMIKKSGVDVAAELGKNEFENEIIIDNGVVQRSGTVASLARSIDSLTMATLPIWTANDSRCLREVPALLSSVSAITSRQSCFRKSSVPVPSPPRCSTAIGWKM